MMGGSPKSKILSLLRSRKAIKRTIIVGLKSDHSGREMLLGLLTKVAKPGDNVLAVHVEEPDHTFDPNSFHIHEDLCKTKKVDLLVQVCAGDDYISQLAHHVRVNNATILALGCAISGPKDSVVNTIIKRLPPTCTVLVIDIEGKILVEKQGTSQQGSTKAVLKSSLSSPVKNSSFHGELMASRFNKSFTMPSSSTSSLSEMRPADTMDQHSVKKRSLAPIFLEEKLEGIARRFTSLELCCATNNFSPEMVIAEGEHSRVYRANLEDGRAAAVKVLKYTHSSTEEILRGVEILSRMKHEHIVQIIGYCDSEDLCAVVYNLLKGSLKQHLKQLKWSERMSVATGVAQALVYLHHSCNPPIFHNQVKSSKILLSDDWQPQLFDFGAATVQNQSQQPVTNVKLLNAVATAGYLGPEHTKFGNFDEKTDVYSYGVVLLELITGREANEAKQTNHESLVLWARSLLSSGLCEHLIDPNVKEDYNKEEMEMVMSAARLCLIHSVSRRPTMEMILRLFQQPNSWLKTLPEKDDLLNRINFRVETDQWREEGSDSNGSVIMDDV